MGRFLIWLLATRVVGVCDAARGFSAARDAQWLTVYNGIPHDELQGEIARVDGRPEGPTRILALGRIHPHKRYWRFAPIFDALRRLPGHEQTTLHIVGAGAPEDEQRLRRTIAASPFRDSIVLHGETADPMPFYRDSDVLLLTSGHEGLPGTAIEALSVGTPVVSVDLPGVREIAGHMPGASIVRDGAGDAEWARAVEAVLTESDRRAIIRGFHQSPFLFRRYVADIMRLWGVGADPAVDDRQRAPAPPAAPLRVAAVAAMVHD